jgi:magnesium chelatase family protein
VNADLDTTADMERYCELDASAEKLLTAARRQLHFTPLHLIRTLRVARTIADLAGAAPILANHLAEAISYRLRFAR